MRARRQQITATRASEQTGLPWTSNLLIVLRLSLVEPTLWLLVLGAAIPSLAAVLVCASARPSQIRHQITKAMPFALIAVGIVLLTGRRLGLCKDPT